MKQPGFQQETENTNAVGLPHDAYFNELIEREYGRLKAQGHTYLDYTGGNLYAISQLKQHMDLLENNVLGNPHSTNPTSVLATQLVEEARWKVLDFFNAQDYFCIFTSNASNALKVVGECYPFSGDSYLLLLSDNHNSVNGIREYCRNRGGEFSYCPVQYEDLRIDSRSLQQELESHGDRKNRLFAFPAQSNVSGVKHDLEWVRRAADLGWDVMLDAAAFVPTSKLDLGAVQADFVSVSFYKIFGYPTGLGCLLVKKSKFPRLRKQWFAGGTVTLVSVQSGHHYLAGNHERFENGTLNYLDIPALKIGLDYIESIGMDRIGERISGLIRHLYARLKSVRHQDGKPVVRLFGPQNHDFCGGTLIMNFVDREGKTYPFELVEEKANARMISIRSGCFCNPGIDEVNNCLTTEELATYFTSRESGNYHDMIDFLHKMRGATRVSVGIATSGTDLDTFVSFAEGFQDKSIDEIRLG